MRIPGFHDRRTTAAIRIRLVAANVVVLLWVLIAPIAAQAQTADDEDAALDEAAAAGPVAPPSDVEVIRIKGRAVTAIETDVPESATQFDAAAIEAMGAQNISDLAKVTPNVEIVTSGNTSPTFFIRGVGLSDFNSNAAGAVGIYQDDVAINAPAIQLGQLFDIENVEVLRGPQGGGSGRNASAGAIKVYSRKPTGDTTADFQTSYGRFNSQDYQGALEVPIIDEILSSRFAFRFVQADGYLENSCSNGARSEVPAAADIIDENNVLIPSAIPADRLPPPWPGPPADKLEFREQSFCGERPGLPTNRAPVRPSPYYRNEEYYPFDASLPNSQQQFEAVRWSALPPDLPDRLNDAHNWSVRGQFRLQPPDTDMDWLLNGHGGRRDEYSYLGQAMGTQGGNLGQQTVEGYQEADNKKMFDALLEEMSDEEARDALATELARNLDIDRYRGDYNRVGKTTLDSWGTFLRGEGSLGDARWTTISAYDGYKRFRDTDNDFTPDVLFEAVDEDEAWQFSQELKFDGELEDTPLRWEVGGYYLMQELEFSGKTFLRFDQSNGRDYAEDLFSFAFFGGFAWDFLDDFTLEGGVRYNWERKDFAYQLTQNDLVNPTEFDSRVWQAPTGTISLTYRPVEDVSVYWKYSRGWKGGQFNASAVSAQRTGDPIIKAAEPEEIDAWEIGMRGRWLDGRLGIGGSLFYYKYANYQVFVVVDAANAPPNIEVVNANDAEVYGAELDVRAEPLDGLVITGRLGWLESQFLDFSNTVFRNIGLPGGGGVVRETGLTADFSGNTLINSPNLKASLAVEWTIDMGRWGSLIPRYDFAWTDDIYFDASEGRGALDDTGAQPLPEYAVGQRAYFLHNARLAYRTPEGNIEIAAFARNFLNQAYKTYAFDASAFTQTTINFVGPPRMIGGSVAISW